MIVIESIQYEYSGLGDRIARMNVLATDADAENAMDAYMLGALFGDAAKSARASRSDRCAYCGTERDASANKCENCGAVQFGT